MNDLRTLTNKSFHYHLKETETYNPINKDVKINDNKNISDKNLDNDIKINDSSKEVKSFKDSNGEPVSYKFDNIVKNAQNVLKSENIASKLDKMKPEEIKNIVSSISNKKTTENLDKKISNIIVSMENKSNMQEVFNSLEGDLFENVINSIPTELDKQPVEKSVEFFKRLEPSATAKFLEKMSPDKISKVLDTFDKESSGRILKELSKLPSAQDGKMLSNVITSMENKANMQESFDLIDGNLFENVINSIPTELGKQPIEKSVEFLKRLTPNAVEKFLEKMPTEKSNQIRELLK